MSAAPELPAVKQAAVAWFTRQRGGLTEAESRELDVWLEADPAHVEAFEAVARAWARMELPRETPELVALRARALKETPSRRWPSAFVRRTVSVFSVTTEPSGSVTVERWPTSVRKVWLGSSCERHRFSCTEPQPPSPSTAAAAIPAAARQDSRRDGRCLACARIDSTSGASRVCSKPPHSASTASNASRWRRSASSQSLSAWASAALMSPER